MSTCTSTGKVDLRFADGSSPGAWQNFIYANGQKIAKLDGQKPVFQLKGTRTAQTLACGIAVQDSAATAALGSIGTIQPNDRLYVDMLEPVVSGGGATMGGFFVQLDGQNWAPTDAQGVYSHEQQATDGEWHHRSFAIGQQAAGHALTWLGINMQNPTPAGNWEIDYGNLTYVKGDGTGVNIPLSADGLSATPQNGCASINLTALTATLPVPAEEGTTYFLADHLGTTQMELSSGGWPVWQGYFSPYGKELMQVDALGTQAADGTSMRFKFTGKERDTESGLDYFGARYYASSMGRWMSPDWSAKAEPVPYAKLDNPQSLNLYTYGLNDPLSKADADGHFPWCALGPGACAIQAVVQGVQRDGAAAYSRNAGIGALKGAGLFAKNSSPMTMFAKTPKALKPVNQSQAGAATATQVVLGSVAGPAFGAVGATTGVATVSTEGVLAKLAAQAVENVGPGSGAVYGTLIHSEFANLVEGLGNSNLATEVSYLGGKVVPYGTAGSIRVDALEGALESPTQVFDLKTGNASLSATRIDQIQSQIPGGNNVPVTQIKPR